MHEVLAIARDVLTEARSRKWLLGLCALVTLLSLAFAALLRFEVVNGAIVAAKIFNNLMTHDIQTAQSAIRPLLQAISWTMFSMGLVFGIVSCSDFGPQILAPGRIELLLSMPVRRWQIVVGTYLGVIAVAAVCTGYATLLFTLVIGFKTTVWDTTILTAAFASLVGFAAIYSLMLTTAVFLRSSALSSALGGVLLLLGTTVVQPEFVALFDRGWERVTATLLTCWLPRLGQLMAIQSFGSNSFSALDLIRIYLGTLVFAGAMLFVAIWELERKDY
jgi:Cu-processing system permease protein